MPLQRDCRRLSEAEREAVMAGVSKAPALSFGLAHLMDSAKRIGSNRDGRHFMPSFPLSLKSLPPAIKCPEFEFRCPKPICANRINGFVGVIVWTFKPDISKKPDI